MATKTAEAVQPPWAVTARRGFHESARSGYSQIGTAYYNDVLEQRRTAKLGETGATAATGGDAQTGRSQGSRRPQTGMSRLVGV